MTSQTLKEAYQYIKAGDKSTARQLLELYTDQHPDDANGWWLMAHAVTHPDQRRHYLERVLDLNPGYAPAEKELRQLSAAGVPKRPAPKPGKRKKKKNSNNVEMVIGIVLIVTALTMIVCGGLFFAVSRGTTALVDEIAQNITVEAGGAGGNSSNLAVFQNNIWDVDNNGAIQVGQTKSGRIGDIFVDEGWLFEGRSGQTITIEVNGSGELDPRITVYAPNGREIAYNDDIRAFVNLDARVQVTLDEAGTYGIVVGSWTDGGGYQLSVR
jgi:hypothetical protein